MLALVNSGVVPGLIAYVDGKPAGWSSVSPREQFVRLNNSRTLKSPDPQRVYSVVCLFVKRPHRRQGLSSLLLKPPAIGSRPAAGASSKDIPSCRARTRSPT
jgi:hypothetical protein